MYVGGNGMRSKILLILALLGVVAMLAWRHWQGVEVPVYQVRLLPLEQRVVASGQVRNQSLARVGAEITGVIEQRHVREGDRVEAGTLLASLRADEARAQLQQAQTALEQLRRQQYPQARASLDEARLLWQQAEREAQRRSRLVEEGAISTEQREQAVSLAQTRKAGLLRAELAVAALQPGGEDEQLLQQRVAAARAVLERTQIRSPFAGEVQSRAAEPGDQVQPGRVLFEIARDAGLEIVAAVDEKFIAPLAAGQQAVVIADAWPDQQLSAALRYLSPAVNEADGTLAVHLDVDDPQELLRLGMTVSVSIRVATREQALAIPRDYLLVDGAGPQVLVLEQDRLQVRPVTLGLQAGTRVEIVQGLKAGDLLVLPEHQPGDNRRVRAASMENPG